MCPTIEPGCGIICFCWLLIINANFAGFDSTYDGGQSIGIQVQGQQEADYIQFTLTEAAGLLKAACMLAEHDQSELREELCTLLCSVQSFFCFVYVAQANIQVLHLCNLVVLEWGCISCSWGCKHMQTYNTSTSTSMSHT